MSCSSKGGLPIHNARSLQCARSFGGQHARRRYRVRRYVGRDRPNGPSMGRLTLNVLLSLIESPTLRFSSSFFGRRTKELDDPKVSNPTWARNGIARICLTHPPPLDVRFLPSSLRKVTSLPKRTRSGSSIGSNNWALALRAAKYRRSRAARAIALRSVFRSAFV